MSPLAHVAGIPLEEILPGALAGLVGARTWLTIQVRRRRGGAR